MAGSNSSHAQCSVYAGCGIAAQSTEWFFRRGGLNGRSDKNRMVTIGEELGFMDAGLKCCVAV